MKSLLPSSVIFALMALPSPHSQAAPAPTPPLNEQQAVTTLTTFVGSHRTYGVPAECLRAQPLEYKNLGYTIDLFAQPCPGTVPGTHLGRWRVDARNADVFVRDGRGKFVAPAASPPSGNTTAAIREERTVIVDGVSERWRLEWAGPTVEVCSPDQSWGAEWGMCPCSGFEFSEDGDIYLVRERPGVPAERLHLTPFFRADQAPGKQAVLRRWPVAPGDEDSSEAPGFAERVRARPLTPMMALADYDHDGQATEFALQIGAIPCGHQQTIIVGIDSHNPRLHAFASVEQPGTPLVLENPQQWEELRRGSGQATIVLWACGDHGSEHDRTIRLRAAKDGLHAKVDLKACP